ncbi:MAG: carbamoyltransferase HypF [Halodesulfurarchaeum sp.]|nr:carbamoyltransferase HypF [Halodesulfurarchaeum sp.]
MTDSSIRASVQVQGVVQGVGFRPFVYRRAAEHDLAGSVRNTGDAGVEILLQGNSGAVDAFLADLRDSPPPLSRVTTVEVDRRPVTNVEPLEHSEEFRIQESVDSEGGTGTIPPDTGVCDACLADIRDPDSRYHRYWATSCVDCGPRYTVIRDLPYDRPRTSMDAYPMCPSCQSEYDDPADRRYHAQTIACPDCGPTLSLQESAEAGRRERATGPAALQAAAARLAAGEILAVRGVGGTHLACDATNATAVERLRERTNRPGKPFAVMAPTIDHVRSVASVTAAERELLEDVRRPIVVLDRDDGGQLEGVAPGLHTIGVMLPYAGLHHLLFDPGAGDGSTRGTAHLDGPLVMTSGNMPGEPMCVTVDSIFEQLGPVIDAALVHDREIVARCDDSVLRSVDGTRRFLRRSRGWVPQPLPRRGAGPAILAVGAEFDATVALARDDEVFPSQHLGDVDGPATEGFLRETVDHLTGLLGVEPQVVACDAHPDFLTSQFAEEHADRLDTDSAGQSKSADRASDKGPIRVQHHHAHAASLLGEHDLDRAIVIVADGTGYGSDGTIWGGEVLDATRADFERVGGLDTFRLPGGEAAIERPARILASLLDDPARIDAVVTERTSLSVDEAATVRASLEAGVNAPATTSAGRFLDAMSALLGVCTERRYEGEPAIRLEAAAAGADPLDLELPFARRDGHRVLDVRSLVRQFDELVGTESTGVLAATAQDALAQGLASIAIEAARTRGVDAIGFSGGVAYNEAISRRIRKRVEVVDLEYLDHELVPPGDAGISYGQTLVASARLDQ